MVFNVKWRVESSEYPSFEVHTIFKCDHIQRLNDNLPMLNKTTPKNIRKDKNINIRSNSKLPSSLNTEKHKMLKTEEAIRKKCVLVEFLTFPYNQTRPAGGNYHLDIILKYISQ